MSKRLAKYTAAGRRESGGVVIIVTLTYEDGSTVTYTRGSNIADGATDVVVTEPEE